MGRDSCGVYSVSRFLLGIGVGHLWRFSAFVAFMRHAGWSVYFIYLFIFFFVCDVACSVVFYLFIYLFFIGLWDWTFVALSSVCSVYEGCRLVFLFHLFIYLFFLCVTLRVAFMGHWGGNLVAFTVLVGFYWALGLDICGAFQRL